MKGMSKLFTKKRTGLVIGSFLLITTAFAQRIDRNVYSSSGKYMNGSSVSIGFTIGESVVFTGVGPGIILSQGFEQPDKPLITSIPSSTSLMYMNAFPNPVKDQLYIQLNNTSATDLQLEIFNVQGKRMQAGNDINRIAALDNLLSLNFSSYAPGIYFVRIWSDINHLNNVVKIIKE